MCWILIKQTEFRAPSIVIWSGLTSISLPLTVSRTVCITNLEPMSFLMV
ncbi:hypothetical protein I33_3274 [Bacillus subtilis subsp. subtilis str. RO-NN-1]|nr:hypothetical protein I33_3274 [Bacillus subtilis subsp. subtilis str. RO-NN-1]